MKLLVLVVFLVVALTCDDCYGRPGRDTINKPPHHQVQEENITGNIGLHDVVDEVVSHPPAFTLDDDERQVLTSTHIVSHPPAFTMDDDERQVLPGTLPFEMSNPSHVSAEELYQSDMLLSAEQLAALRTRKALNYTQMRWTEGDDGYPLVPYIFQDSVSQNDVRAGLDHWMEHTCIKFEETSNTDQPHLQFHIGQGCWSYVGMNYWMNGQQISIGSSCNKYSTVAHEVGHAMGLFHEQARSDRDDYIIILKDNIDESKWGNFGKAPDDNYGVPYDYSSLMHYGMYYFTKNNRPTIITKDPLEQELLGTRNGLTHRDKLLANRMYNCTGKWLAECSLSSDPCLNGGYTGKDCNCICSPGTNGRDCRDVTEDYYAHARDPLSEIISTEKIITVITPMYAGTAFTKWIVPPTCTKAKLTVASARLYHGWCGYQHLNVKTNTSDLMGQIMCAADVKPGLTLTSDTGIIITMINYVNYSFTRTLLEAHVTFERIPGCSFTFYQK